MKDTYLVRPASREDAGEIARMYQETWPVAWNTPEKVRRQFDLLESIGGAVLVAVEEGRVVGHAEFIATREPAPYGHWGYLEALQVHHEWYRRGVGTALVREAVCRCAALGCTRFGTLPEDERSEGLYRKVGMVNEEPATEMRWAWQGEPETVAPTDLRELSVDERPWESFLHVLGRFHCASYWWARALQDKADGEESFAVLAEFAAGPAVVFSCGSWLHVLVPPEQASDRALAAAAVRYGADRIRRLGQEGLRTVVPPDLADAVCALPGLSLGATDALCHLWMPLDPVNQLGPRVAARALAEGYRAMAADEEREAEALAWSEGLVGESSRSEQ